MVNLIVVEAEGAMNSIRQCSTRPTRVPVQNATHKPAAGAGLVFTLASQGETLSDAAQMFAVLTDAQGQAVTHGLIVNRVSGRWQMRVNASFGNRTGTARMTQINEPASAAGGRRGGHLRKGDCDRRSGRITVWIAAPKTTTFRTDTIGHLEVTLHD